mmetsp:Transcript_7591/g.19199  ORF Transcript_7591/g.19199 Transcript_7591/m.19199 type:complete len:529 (-) Transcript_7591:135-1721(-)
MKDGIQLSVDSITTVLKRTQDSTGLSSTATGATAVILLLGYSAYLQIRPLPVDSSIPSHDAGSWPILGFLPEAIRNWPHWPSETMRLCLKYKRTWGGKVPNLGGLPGACFYTFQEPQIQYVLSNVNLFVKGDIWEKVFGELLGRGIFAVDGERWKKHRKLMSHLFSRNLLRHNAQVMRKKLFQCIQWFQGKTKDGDTTKGFSIDIQEVFFRLMFDVTTSVTFGRDLDSVGKEQQHVFPRAFDELSFLCQKRFLDPLFEFKRFFQLGQRERRIRELSKVIDDFVLELINDRRINLDLLKMDILSTYIESANRAGEEITDEDLRDVVLNVLLAGRDTTAAAISWTWFELSRSPTTVAKIIQEVKQVCGAFVEGESSLESFSFDNMNKLRYTHCVALEVIRLHPPVPEDPRYATQNCTLPDGTKIPAGAGVDLCIMAAGRNPDVWGEDANQFYPERFLDAKEPSPFRYPMFNAGPRMCLGRPLALMNMKLAMSMLLPLFDFQDEEGHAGDYQWTLVQSIKDGFPVQVSRRY